MEEVMQTKGYYVIYYVTNLLEHIEAFKGPVVSFFCTKTGYYYRVVLLWLHEVSCAKYNG